MATTYAYDTYAPQLKAAQEYQDYVAWHLLREGIVLVNYQSRQAQFRHGENALGMEIKFDRKLHETRNLYIEIAEKADPANDAWIPSGIHRQDNSWLYAVGDYRGLYLFSIRTLRLVHRARRYRTIETPTSQGFLIPLTDASKLAERIFGPWNEQAV